MYQVIVSNIRLLVHVYHVDMYLVVGALNVHADGMTRLLIVSYQKPYFTFIKVVVCQLAARVKKRNLFPRCQRGQRIFVRNVVSRRLRLGLLLTQMNGNVVSVVIGFA